MKILLYSTGCPKCNILKQKMNMKNISYEEISDLKTLQDLGLQTVPYLQIDNEQLMNFLEANEWINRQ